MGIADFWMGLNDIDEEGVYRWVGSGEVTNWQRWKSGEPDTSGDEDCVSVFGYEWADRGCDLEEYYSICEPAP